MRFGSRRRYSSAVAGLIDRSCLTAEGVDAAALLQSLLSNDVELAQPGGGVYALLLTPKARVIADIELFNVDGGYVLACPPGRADEVLNAVLRARFRRKVDLQLSPHAVVWGEAAGALATLHTPAGPHRLLVAAPGDAEPAQAWELARVEAGMPRYGREFDDGTMPAEAGLVPLAISFSKGCYPGQEPVARLQYRGHANRGLRGLELQGDLPAAGEPVVLDDRDVGRLTSPVESPRFGPISLAVLRREVADGDRVTVAGTPAIVRPLPFAA
jgi:folate-binding protein YgfZ